MKPQNLYKKWNLGVCKVVSVFVLALPLHFLVFILKTKQNKANSRIAKQSNGQKSDRVPQPAWSFSASFSTLLYCDVGWNQCLYVSTVNTPLSALGLLQKKTQRFPDWEWCRNKDSHSGANASGWMIPRVLLMTAILQSDPCGMFLTSKWLGFL